MQHKKKVTAIVVNWNGREFLPTCLSSLFNQTYEELEVIVVDCASKDGSVFFIKSNYPLAKVIELKKDLGPPYAINLACQKAQGEYILILNNDVYLPPDLTTKMVREIKRDEYSVINPLQLKTDGSWVGAGYSIPLFGVNRLIKIKGEYPFYPCTACCLTTKKMLTDNPLNERFFLYEDAEWGWRLKLKKIKCRVVADGYFLHENAGTIGFGSPRQVRYATFSYIATRYICFKNSTLLASSPLFLLVLLKNFSRSWLKGAKIGWSFLGGICSFLKRTNEFSKYRRKIQVERSIKSDIQIIKEMIASHDFEINFKKNWQKDHQKILEEKIKRDLKNFTGFLQTAKKPEE